MLMAASGKFNLSSSSPDRPLFTPGPRGSLTAASMDRSGSFRESTENSMLSALPSMTRNSTAVTQGEVMSFFQCLRFDPKFMVMDNKFYRFGDFKRQISMALGVSPDESSCGSLKSKLPASPVPDEIKRVKATLREGTVKARERTKLFNEASSVFNKYFPTIPSKKRSRMDVFPSERSSALLSGDKVILGSNMSKMGTQNHTTAFEFEQQKSDERTRPTITNKRTRTSMADVKLDIRANSLARVSGAMDRDREVLRLPGSGAVQGEDRVSSIGDGWEKSKMKKKRSRIKPDIPVDGVSTKTTDVYREPKQGMHQRVNDARLRNSNSHGLRSGVANGAAGVGKADSVLQQPGFSMRSPVTRTEQEISPLLCDRRDRPSNSEKERLNFRAVNKTNVRDDFNSASPTSSTKINVPARAPRSGSNIVPKSSPSLQRASMSNDWEISQCSNKLPIASGANNRKRMPSMRSSSPPVTPWTDQRPQKISRTANARRANFSPIVPNGDDNPGIETVSDVGGNENGFEIARRMSGSSPQRVKLKGDHFSSPALSESDESAAAAEIKSRDNKKLDDGDDKSGENVQKMSTLVLPSRKNKLVGGDDLGDGVRRQGRSGRSFTSTRSLMPMMVEKLGNVETAKQLRSTRLGFEKSESKAGRPPTRKLSDRKPYTRQRHTANSTTDCLVGSVDGREELLAAANDIINPAFSSKFWKEMEQIFGFLPDVDIAFLKQEGNIGTVASTPSLAPPLLDADGNDTVCNGFVLDNHAGEMSYPTEEKIAEPFPQQLVPRARGSPAISLCQRLIAALISEEDVEDFCYEGNVDLICGADCVLDTKLESNILHNRSLGNLQIFGLPHINGCRTVASGMFLNEQRRTSDNNIVSMPKAGIISNLSHSLDGLLSDQLSALGVQYNNMSLDNRLLLEIQSIGIFPEAVPDMELSEDEEIIEDISKLEDKYHEMASRKKGMIGKLLKSVLQARELQEKEYEQRAMDRLVAIAYEKYMACWGPSHGGKSSSSKMARQAALAFVKRTLERCQIYEDTGMSCFSEPIFKDVFASRFSCFTGTPSAVTGTKGEFSRSDAFVGSHQSPLTSQFDQEMDNMNLYCSDAPPVNQFSEQNTGREDTWSSRVRKRELLLDDVGGTLGALNNAPGVGRALSSSTKGRRSERDREGKGNSREMLPRSGTAKLGRPALSNSKGERKSKAKPKQKTTQLSASVNGLLGKMPEQAKQTLPSVTKSSELVASSNAKEKGEFILDALDESEAIDLSNLQLPEMDVLGVPDDLVDQGQDLGSWLNIEDDGLQDHDYMGLEIPMDDLSDLNMMV